MNALPRSKPNPELDDLTLARAKRGDQAACRALVERYQVPVFAVLHRMMGPQDRDLVEDLAQEAFLKVFRSLDGFRPSGPAKPSTWILTIASRVAIDALRKRPKQPALTATAPEVIAPHSTDAGTRRRELSEALAQATQQLNEAQRLAFILREHEGLAYDEIAAIAGVDVGTIKSRLSRARTQLRSALADHHPSAARAAGEERGAS